jgi:Mrp family chromosome partitioning ATPase
MAGLTSGRLQQILEQGAAHYDWVIVDTPPVALQPDAQLIAAMVEAIVFVVGAGISQAPVVQHAIETVGRDKIVGVVLNRVDAGTFNEAAYQDYYQDPAPASAPGAQPSSIAAGQ